MSNAPTTALSTVESSLVSQSIQVELAPATTVVALWEIEATQATGEDPKRDCEELRDVFLATGDDSKARLLALWPSRGAFQREQAKFSARLSLATTPQVAEIWRPWPSQKPWWKRLKLSQWILGLVAILGALEGLRIHFLTLLETPDLQLAVIKWETNVIQGGTIVGELEVINPLLIRQRIREVEIELIRQDSGRKSTQVLQSILERNILEAGGRSRLIFSGTAGQPGKYLMNARIQSRAGDLRAGKNFTLQRDLRSWFGQPVLLELLEKTEISAGQRTIRISFDVGPGTPLECRICLPAAPLTNPSLLVSSAELATPDISVVGNRCAKWIQGAVPSFSKYNFWFLFDRNPAMAGNLNKRDVICRKASNEK